MKVAIVGTTTNLSENEDRDMRQFIAITLKNLPPHTTIVSGGAKGVDTIAKEIATGLGLKTEIHNPILSTWSEFKKRNLIIADQCDELFCFTVPTRKTKCFHHNTVQNHEKTAGCWTARKAEQLGKPTKLIVLPNRLTVENAS